MGAFWILLRGALHFHGKHVAGLVTLLLIASAAFGQFQPHPVAGLPGLIESSVAWGDYDNDGLLDLFVAGTTDTLGGTPFDLSKNFTKIFHNNGDGTFADTVAHLVPVFVATAAWGDYDNDGYLDLVYGGVDTANAQVTKLYHNNHDGTFTEVANSFHSASYGALAWGDFNNDGRIDLLIGAFDLAGPTTKLYENNGGGNFTEVTNPGLQGVNGHGKVAWADLNNDGYQDVVLCGRTNSDSETDPMPITKVFFNHQGDGTFTEDTSAHFVGIWKGGMSVGDLNNDGKIDILLGGAYTGITENNDTTLAYLNNGDGTFTAIDPGIPGVIHAFITLGDYNADGRLDALVKGYGSNSGIYRGNGDGTFTHVAVDQAEMGFGSAAWGDFNNDGYLDYIAAGVDGRTNIDSTVVFINNGPGTSTATPYTANVKPNPPTTLHAVVADSAVTFSWTGGTDDKTPASGLTYALRVGTRPNGADILSPLSDSAGFRHVTKIGNAFHDTSWVLAGLPHGMYYWSVQAVDNGFAGSSFAVEDSFRVGPPPVPPVTGARVTPLVFLQGPFESTSNTMNDSLNAKGELANHFGNSIYIPMHAVDSVAVEIRDSLTASASTVHRSLPAWLMTDGTVRSFKDSVDYVQFDSVATGSYYIIIHHRNHLAVMSAARVMLNDTATTTYDFTTGQNKAWGDDPMIAVGTKYAMVAGDGNGSGGVNASDLNGVWRTENGQLGYLRGDYNLSGGVNATDRNAFWKTNNGKLSQVP